MKTQIYFIVLAAWLLSLWAPACQGDDKDGDGLDDAIEDMLLDRHRPILYYENDERHWPISIAEFVQHSALVAYYGTPLVGETCTIAKQRLVYSEPQLANDPTLILHGLDGFGAVHSHWCVDDTGFLQTPAPKWKWRLDLNDSWRSGVYPGPDGQAHRGMYGHVTPRTGGQIRLQYWQLFPQPCVACHSHGFGLRNRSVAPSAGCADTKPAWDNS